VFAEESFAVFAQIRKSFFRKKFQNWWTANVLSIFSKNLSFFV